MASARSNIKSVSQITARLKHLLESDFRFVHVSGEISNLRTPFSGHAYFVLKDQKAQLRCVLFKNQRRYLDKTIEDGQKVVCHGRITVYEPRGDYQLIVDTIDHSGAGDLQAEFEQLKDKLNKEGLFDPGSKKTIPAPPSHVSVITSPTGAALQDFLKVHSNKLSSCSISVMPVAVQGQQAAGEIARAIEQVNAQLTTDCIVLCRGGGSLEDLWAFNEEILARAIHKSKIPIVSAVGHEIDFTIADFCADQRCPTPTSAAELLFPDNSVGMFQLNRLQNRLSMAMKNSIRHRDKSLHYSIRLLGNLDSVFHNCDLRLDHTWTRFLRGFQDQLQQKDSKLDKLSANLASQSPQNKLDLAERQLFHLQEKLFLSKNHLLAKKEGEFAKLAALLDSVSPLATLSRGYSIVQKKSTDSAGKKPVITSSKQVSTHDSVEILLHDGELECEVIRVK